MNWFKLVLEFTILLIGGSVFYYLVIYIPNRDEQNRINQNINQKIKEDAEKLSKEDLEWKLKGCLLEAEMDKTRFWNSECEGKGLKENCSLPTYNADRVDASEKQAKDFCFKQYK